jgi:hypothetical protein
LAGHHDAAPLFSHCGPSCILQHFCQPSADIRDLPAVSGKLTNIRFMRSVAEVEFKSPGAKPFAGLA